jgi:hypothetical protein
MAAKKRGGEVENLTVVILREIRDEIRELRADTNARFAEVDHHLGSLDQRVGSLEKGLATLEATTARGFEAVTARLENLRDFSGELWRDHEQRLRKLESHATR